MTTLSYLLTSFNSFFGKAKNTGEDDEDDANFLRHRQMIEFEAVVVIAAVAGLLNLRHLKHILIHLKMILIRLKIILIRLQLIININYA